MTWQQPPAGGNLLCWGLHTSANPQIMQPPNLTAIRVGHDSQNNGVYNWFSCDTSNLQSQTWMCTGGTTSIFTISRNGKNTFSIGGVLSPTQVSTFAPQINHAREHNLKLCLELTIWASDNTPKILRKAISAYDIPNSNGLEMLNTVWGMQLFNIHFSQDGLYRCRARIFWAFTTSYQGIVEVCSIVQNSTVREKEFYLNVIASATPQPNDGLDGSAPMPPDPTPAPPEITNPPVSPPPIPDTGGGNWVFPPSNVTLDNKTPEKKWYESDIIYWLIGGGIAIFGVLALILILTRRN